MSIELIDLLKPKNGLNFKLIEDVDIAVQGYESLADAVSHFVTQSAVQQIINAALSGKQDKLTTEQLTAVNSGITAQLVTQIGTNTTAIAGKADAADLAALSDVVDTKADASDLTSETANLQAQINALITPVTQDAEVENARIDSNGKSYTTLKDRLDAEEENTEEYLYELITDPRQLFDINTMIPATPLAIGVQESQSKLISNNGYRMYYIEINGKQGEEYSYNFCEKSGVTVPNFNLCFMCASNKLPEVDDTVQIGTNSAPNKRGKITLTNDSKYLLFAINSTVASYPPEGVTTACNTIMEYIVVRKGDYNSTYYPYVKYADYKMIIGEDNLSVGVKSNINALGNDIDDINSNISEYLYNIVPYDRQLFDINTMIPAVPIEMTIQESQSKLVAHSGYRGYVVEINGHNGDFYSYNFLTKDGVAVSDFDFCYICASNKLPEVDDIVQVGVYSTPNMRGYITLSGDKKYLIFFVASSATTSTDDEYTEACNDLMDHIVVRKGDYDSTYYDYEEHAEYVFGSSDIDEQEVIDIINDNAVSNDQGSENHGKILVVGSDGFVTLAESSGGGVTEDVAVRYHPSKSFNVGENIISASTPVTLGTNWSGDFTNGFTHTAGALGEIVIEAATESGASYYIDFDVSAQASNNMGVTIGDNPYCDPYNGNTHYNVGVISDGGYLKIKATATSLATTITNLKLRKVVAEGTTITLNTKNVNNGQATSNITGFWNIAIGGLDTQSSNENGSRNIAIGEQSQHKLKSGTRNVSIGTFSMPFITEGERNIAIGADTIYNTTQLTESKAYDNVAIGKGTMKNGTLIANNIAIGTNAMESNTATAAGNIAIGCSAGMYAAEKNTHIGTQAGYYTKGNGNTSLGYNAGNTLYVSGNNNVCIGYEAGFDVAGAASSDVKTVSNSIAIGANVKATASDQAVIGNNSQTLILCGKRITFNNDHTVTWESIE